MSLIPGPRITQLGFVSAFAAVLACSVSVARADIMVGADLDTVIPLESPAKTGGGFSIRIGDQLHLPMVAITPELAFNYASFSEVYGPKVYRGLVGLRLAVGEVIRPGIFAHVGFGRYDLEIPGAMPSGTALTYDGGISLDFTLLPLLNLGVHGAYNILAGDDGDRDRFRWLTVGAHLELVF